MQRCPQLIGQGVSNIGVTFGAVYFDTYLAGFDSKVIRPLVSAQFFVWRSPAVLRGHSSVSAELSNSGSSIVMD